VRRVLAALVKADLSALMLNNCGDRSPQTKAVTSPSTPCFGDLLLALDGAMPNKKRSLFAIRSQLPASTALALGFVAPILVIGAWCVLSYGNLVKPDFLPAPTEVVKGTIQLFLNYDLGTAILVSTRRIALAFLLASALALPLGILMGTFDPINRLFEPIMAPLRYMPISAFIPLLILWFGIYEKQKIAFLFLGVFVYLLPVVVSAIRLVPEELVQTALTLGASKFQVIRTVLLPAALPEIFDSFRVMNAIAWTYVILAEAVNPERGLGYMVELARTHQKASWSFAGLLVIGGIGLLTDFLIRAVSGVLFRWREAT
jgi:NitT/TauT family transport system permease protein